jgi:sugar phosphate isomerase/epimerase
MESRLARRHGFTFAYHLYDFDLKAAPTCINAIRDTGCMFELDTFYVRRSGMSWDGVVSALRDDIVAVHINDTAEDGSQASIGGGIERWPGLFGYMGQFSICENLIVEHDAPGDRGMAMARRSGDYLLSTSTLLQTYWKNRRTCDLRSR